MWNVKTAFSQGLSGAGLDQALKAMVRRCPFMKLNPSVVAYAEGSLPASALREMARLCPVVGSHVSEAQAPAAAPAAATPLSEDVARVAGITHAHHDVAAFMAAGVTAPNICPYSSVAAKSAPAAPAPSVSASAPAPAPAKPVQPPAAAAAPPSVTSGPPEVYNARFQELIDKKKSTNTYRVFKHINRHANSTTPVADGRSAMSTPTLADALQMKAPDIDVWCSNDYLGMGRHPKVLQAAATALMRHGTGAGGTRNIGGNGLFHELLEHSLADLHQMERALIFTSCFVANDSALATLGRMLPGCIFFSDEDNHASMIEGMRNSRCEKRLFRHNDVADLEAKLRAAPADRPKIVAFESVYSMCGSIAPIREICEVSRRYGALTFLDEVHAVGLYGARGAGVAERDGVAHMVDMISGTLGKAYGTVGGYIAGSAPLVDMLRSYAPGFIFTTSMPPATAAAALASVEHLKQAPELRAAHQASAARTRAALMRAGIPVMPCPSHIVPVLVGDADRCRQVSDDLMSKHHIYVQSINHPTVPFGTERLRITPSPQHTPEMLDRLVTSLVDVWTANGLKLHAQPAAAAAAAA